MPPAREHLEEHHGTCGWGIAVTFLILSTVPGTRERWGGVPWGKMHTDGETETSRLSSDARLGLNMCIVHVWGS
jgi:hypothetical protein